MKVLALLMTLSVFSFTGKIQAQDATKGEALYKACIECHGENGHGIAAQEAPRIAGQHDWYIVTSLKSFKKKERKNPKMYPFIKDLSEQDYKDLAAYISQLK